MIRAALLLLVATLPAHAADMDRLVKAYPAFLASVDGDTLYWTDGTKQPLGEAGPRAFDAMLKTASLRDQMHIPYPTGPFHPPASAEDDPGRFRNIAFFDKMYGDCDRGEVEKNLISVKWLPKSGGGTVLATKINGVAARLEQISTEIEALPPEIRKFAYPSAGTYNCRVVKDTGIRSAHAYGIAIDLNTKFSDYWLWSGGGKGFVYRNRVPLEIVAIFEKHGFIWGGKWGHYDTMHFEYRPELLP